MQKVRILNNCNGVIKNGIRKYSKCAKPLNECCLVLNTNHGWLNLCTCTGDSQYFSFRSLSYFRFEISWIRWLLCPGGSGAGPPAAATAPAKIVKKEFLQISKRHELVSNPSLKKEFLQISKRHELVSNPSETVSNWSWIRPEPFRNLFWGMKILRNALTSGR